MAVESKEIKRMQRDIESLKKKIARLEKLKTNKRSTPVRKRASVSSPRARKTKQTQWLSLIGAGKEVWKDVDADAYIKKERDSWS
jgi:hypothetical protein